MQHVLIVEDNYEQCENLFQCLLSQYPEWEIQKALNYEDAKELIMASIKSNNFYSLFLLDIQLKNEPNDLGGFVLADEIRTFRPYFSVPILFLTSITDKVSYALSNYHCYNYITKPYSNQDILAQIKQMMLTGYLENNSITIVDTNRVRYRIVQQDIYYIETKSHTLILETAYGKIVTRSITFTEIKEKLCRNFIMCHKKYIVNIEHITNYDAANQKITINTHTIPVSRTYKPFIEETLKGIFI